MTSATWTGRQIAAGRHLDRARAFLEARNGPSALREAACALHETPDGLPAYFALDVMAQAHSMARSWTEVAEIGRRMLAITPRLRNAYCHVATGTLATGDIAACDRSIRDGLAVDPKHHDLMIVAALRWRDAGRLDEAETWARRALEIAPGDTSVTAVLADIAARRGRPRDARRLTTAALAENPADELALASAALIAFRSENYAEARHLAESALRADPRDRACQEILHMSGVYASPVLAPYWLFKRAIDALHFAVVLMIAGVASAAVGWVAGKTGLGWYAAAVTMLTFVYLLGCSVFDYFYMRHRIRKLEPDREITGLANY